ncbi:hypothetical protein EEB19_10150 [Gordonia sp. OPL2]|nr:hypothetical protein EEB19_10150 [Gordonia sp. OPL2]
MTDPSYQFPPHIVAALRAPEGTTVEEIYARFPDAAPKQYPAETMQPPPDDADFRARYQDAVDDWHSRNGWKAMPHHIALQLAEQIRTDIVWERRSRG